MWNEMLHEKVARKHSFTPKNNKKNVENAENTEELLENEIINKVLNFKE